jgi:hypothetical protein
VGSRVADFQRRSGQSPNIRVPGGANSSESDNALDGLRDENPKIWGDVGGAFWRTGTFFLGGCRSAGSGRDRLMFNHVREYSLLRRSLLLSVMPSRSKQRRATGHLVCQEKLRYQQH